MKRGAYDAIVVGSGPNGLAAAVTMARAGLKVKVYEASEKPGGGMRSEELTLPGYVHDVCSAVHPLAVTSPFFRSLPLKEHGLEWIYPPTALAHPLDGEEALSLHCSIEATAAQLKEDEGAYIRLMKPLVAEWEALFGEILKPVVHVPRKPLLLARFGYKALLSAKDFSELFFRGERARALFTGVAAHANCSLRRPATAGLALTLIIAAHARGWPIPRGGSQAIANALISYLRSLGGELELGRRIESVSELPESRRTFFDLIPTELPRLMPAPLADEIRRRFSGFTHGPGVFKIDWALRAPIPWLSQRVLSAGTVHLGGSLSELVVSEDLPEEGKHAQKPFVLLSQPSLFDQTRVPESERIKAGEGGQTVWAYCHVPYASERDMTFEIESQIERFAPGFRSLISQRSVLNTKDLQLKNPNLIGGDISGGAFRLRNMVSAALQPQGPYVLSAERGYYLCSSSTPPGPGVHGMCGTNAALRALQTAERR